MEIQYFPNPPMHRVREAYAWDRPSAVCNTPHFHDQAEIMYVLEGKVVIELDHRSFTYEKGDAVLIFPQQIHRFLEPFGKSRTYTYVFRTRLCPNFSQLFETKRPEDPVIKNADQIPNVRAMMETLLDECNKEETYSEQIISGALQFLLGSFLRRMTLVNRGSMDETTATKIMKFCYEHFREDLTLNATAEALGLSPYYLSHLVPQKFGIRYVDLISALRIEEAIRLIQNGQKISIAALNVGFSNTRAFNRAFLKQYGTSPSDYLRLN